MTENKTIDELIDEVVSCTLEEKVLDAVDDEENPIKLKKEAVNTVLVKGIPAMLVNMYSKIRQLRYYFTYDNLAFNNILKNEMKFNDGWVRISKLSKIRNCKHICEEFNVIAIVLKNDTNSILEVNETNEKIRRINPVNPIPDVNEEFMNELIERSVYCNGFPKTATRLQLVQFVTDFYHEAITKITPRRSKESNTFKGSAYLTFYSKEQAEHFLKQKSVKYNGVELERMWEKDFIIQKKKQMEINWYINIQLMEAKVNKYLKKGYLIKADILNETVNLKTIKTACNSFIWQLAYIKFIEYKKIAWIRLKPLKTAKDVLYEISCETNNPSIIFSIPEEEVEQSVLNEMYKDIMEMQARKSDKKRKKKTEKKENIKRKKFKCRDNH